MLRPPRPPYFPRLVGPLPVPALPLLLFLVGAAFAEWQPEGEDPYELLGVQRDSDLSAAVLKRAYRRAAMKWHPDKAAPDQKKMSEQKFIAVAWAYEVLSDPMKRASFDAGGSGAGGNAGAGSGAGAGAGWTGAGGFSFEEAFKVFENVFGKRSGEYRDLMEHFAKHSAQAGGDAESVRTHAMGILAALSKGDGKNFEVETKTEGRRMKSKQTVTDDGKGTTTKKTVTESTHTHTSGGGAIGGNAFGGHLHHDPHSAAGVGAPFSQDPHIAAHHAAHEAAMAAHRKAVKAQKAGKPRIAEL